MCMGEQAKGRGGGVTADHLAAATREHELHAKAAFRHQLASVPRIAPALLHSPPTGQPLQVGGRWPTHGQYSADVQVPCLLTPTAWVPLESPMVEGRGLEGSMCPYR